MDRASDEAANREIRGPNPSSFTFLINCIILPSLCARGLRKKVELRQVVHAPSVIPLPLVPLMLISPFSSSATLTPTVASIDTGTARIRYSDLSCFFLNSFPLSLTFFVSFFFSSCCSSNRRRASQGQSGGWLEVIPTVGEGRVKSTLGGGT